VSEKPVIKTCGREPSCDLVLEDTTLSRLHARIELVTDGRVFINDADSSNGTFLNRNDSWIRIRRSMLCIGDRIRFGDIEVPLQRITGLFGKRAGIRLEAKRFPARHGKAKSRSSSQPDHGASLHKPRRNPVTGKIEEDQAAKP